jgi:hypothetical protein
LVRKLLKALRRASFSASPAAENVPRPCLCLMIDGFQRNAAENFPPQVADGSLWQFWLTQASSAPRPFNASHLSPSPSKPHKNYEKGRRHRPNRIEIYLPSKGNSSCSNIIYLHIVIVICTKWRYFCHTSAVHNIVYSFHFPYGMTYIVKSRAPYSFLYYIISRASARGHIGSIWSAMSFISILGRDKFSIA